MTTVNLRLPPAALRGCIAIGNFDGVHRGHVAMLGSLRLLADKMNSPAVAVTFDPHPVTILRPEFTPPVLTTIRERSSLLHAAGADHVVVLPVTKDLLQMTSEQFFSDVIVKQLQAIGIVEGPNFHFGRDRQGDVQVLEELCERHGIDCQIVEPVDHDGQMISSSRIRELLCIRELGQAVDLLGHPYRLTGFVTRGDGRGRTIGFPTANLTSVVTFLPAHGVYAGLTVLDDKQFPVAVSIGPNPTFGGHHEKIECHIDGYAGDLYESELSIDLLSEIRDLESFGSVEALVQQIHSDVQTCRTIVARQSPPFGTIP